MRTVRVSVPPVTLPDGAQVPSLGLGTWKMGERAKRAAREVAALQYGLDLGMRLIDTAEMYGEGGAEEIIARAMEGPRASKERAERLAGGRWSRRDVFLVSKVYPHNAGRKQAIAACERSLKRLRTDHLDLYLLHWRGTIPLEQTVAAFEQLQRDGKILRWGVSNFDVADMEELFAVEGGSSCATNQVLYNLERRGIEYALLPWLRARRIPIMAYSPLGQGGLVSQAAVNRISTELGVAPATLLLAWVLRHPDVIAIPQSSNPAHIDANRAAVGLELNKLTLAAIDAAFPPPMRSTPLAMI